MIRASYLVSLMVVLNFTPAYSAPISTEKMDKYSDCLIVKMSELDDGISDASSIALAAAPPCRPLLYFAADQMSKEGATLSTKETYKLFLEDEAANVTAMVLRYRRALQSTKTK